MVVDCRSLCGLRAIARKFSGENFFKMSIEVGYEVKRCHLSTFGLNCDTLWLFSWDSCISKIYSA